MHIRGTEIQLKITILWSRLAGYTVQFFRALAVEQECKIQLVHQPTSGAAPFDTFDLSFCNVSIEDSEEVKKSLSRLVDEFSPDCILMCSWNFRHFMKVARRMRRRGVRVISTIDHQWEGTPKQYLGVVTSRMFLGPAVDNFLVCGDRQAGFSRRLGYDNPWYGLYAADVCKFDTRSPISSRARNFIFVGRLNHIKGIHLLVEAYKRYRHAENDPWGLIVAGVGELEEMLVGVDGVEHVGFVQPDELPELLEGGSCFILPSLWEPWGVVIHEAAAAGLPIIATYECGAVSDYVKDGRNGYVVPSEVGALFDAMKKISGLPLQELEDMSATSSVLSRMWTTSKLGKYFVDMQQQSDSHQRLPAE